MYVDVCGFGRIADEDWRKESCSLTAHTHNSTRAIEPDTPRHGRNKALERHLLIKTNHGMGYC